MEVITSTQEIGSLVHNTILGAPQLDGGKIRFAGQGNILCCEAGVTLKNCSIFFRYSNALVYLCKPRGGYALSLEAEQDSTCYIGKNFRARTTVKIVTAPGKTVFIGDDCLFSRGIMIRASDAHLIYSGVTHQRINPSKSIFIGDHVWLGQEVFPLKGTQIGSGSIVGARGVIPGKRIPSNTCWAGNPVRQVSLEPVFYDAACEYAFDQAQLDQTARNDSDQYLYRKDKYTLSFDELDRALAARETAQQRLDYLDTIRAYTHHNRFFLPQESRGKGLLRRLWSR